MKKTFRLIGAAMFAAVLCSGFASCNSDSEDAPIELPSEIKKTVIDEALALASDKLPEVEGVEKIVTCTSADSKIEKVVLLKGMEAIVYLAKTRALNENTIVCNYEIKDGYIVFLANQYGIVKIPVEGVVTSIKIDGADVPATEVAIGAISSDMTKSLCRPWGYSKFKAGVYFDSVPVWGANDSEKKEYASVIDLKNAVLKKLITDSELKDQGFKILTNNLVGATFLSNGTVFFKFHNAEKNTESIEESEWKWVDEANGKFKTTLDGKNDINIDVRFKNGNPNTAVFIIDANLDGIGGLGKHTLSGRLVCTMSD